MIIDSHTHIFPRSVRENREQFFAGEPAFKLLYDAPNAKLAGASDIIHAMDEGRVDLSVVFGFPWKNPEMVAQHNDYVMASVAKYPERLKGLCCLGPDLKNASGELERCLSGGLSGAGELAFYETGIESGILDRLAPVMALCLARDLPVMFHTNEPVGHKYPGKSPNTLGQIYRLPATFPENKIILAHWGGGLFFYLLLKREAKETLKHVYFDTAASPFLYDISIYQTAINIAGSGKILFGSDYPLIQPARYFKELDAAGLSPTDREAICGENAAALLKL
jgi:predicted TIM-barrel fold metal-dependent hydrolase